MTRDLTVGRWAPSPTGDLHLGNLRTALLAWLFARSAGGRFLWRFEDLDGAVRPQYYDSQLRDMAALGLDWDGEPVRQSERLDLYRDAIADLRRRDLTYECFCTRREIAEAAAAPHGPSPEGAYPGTCRRLTCAELEQRRSSGRPPALRLRVGSDGPEPTEVTVVDRQLGTYTGTVDDFVIQRGDGTPAYNLAVVVDDAAQGITGQVFAVRRNEIFLFDPFRPARSVHRSEGWDAQAIADHAVPALKGHFAALDRSGDVFSWDPL